MPEGTIVPLHNAIMISDNTDDDFYWATSYTETAALRAAWYGSTVATNSWAIKQIFPILPIHRLDEEPTKPVVLADITCDSDGQINCFIALSPF